MSSGTSPAVLVTGASGYIGKLVAVTLLLEEECALVLPLRPHHSINAVRARFAAEIESVGAVMDRGLEQRLHFLPVSLRDDLDQLDGLVKQFGVTQVVHCAACLDYFKSTELDRVNVGLTRKP